MIIDVTNRASLNSVESWLSLYNDNKTVEDIEDTEKEEKKFLEDQRSSSKNSKSTS